MTEDTKLKSILHHSHDQGKWTGLVTNTAVTHATPASAYAHSPERDWAADYYQPEDQKDCKDIAAQLIDEHDYIRVILGGGRKYFLPNYTKDPGDGDTDGRREDKRDLLQEWKEKKAKSHGEQVHFVIMKEELDKLDPEKTEYLLGLFAPKHLEYEADREEHNRKTKTPEPSLKEMTETAIKVLRKSEKGFFLLVEGGKIDKAHHSCKAFKALNETLAFSEAVEVADKLMGDDTLIVVTADHSHTFVIGGYPSINQNIFDITNRVGDNNEITGAIAMDTMPFTILSYANGQGYEYHFQNGSEHATAISRRNLTEDSNKKMMLDKNYIQPAGVPLTSETHGGEDVPIYARGPMSHL